MTNAQLNRVMPTYTGCASIEKTNVHQRSPLFFCLEHLIESLELMFQ